MELAAGDHFTDGFFTLNSENGLHLEADFNVPAAPTLGPTPPATPSPTNSAGIEYLRSIGPTPGPSDHLLQGARATLAANDSYRAAYYVSVTDSAAPTAVPGPQRRRSRRAQYNLPPPITRLKRPDVRRRRLPRVIPEDRWILPLPNPTSWADTQYGVTPESLVLSSGSNPAILR